MNIISVFANNVKKYRAKKGSSQEAFVEKSALHRTYISAIECKTYLLFIDIETIKKKGGLFENEKV